MHQLSYSYSFLGVLIFSITITGTSIITSIGPSHTKKQKFKLNNRNELFVNDFLKQNNLEFIPRN